MPATVRLEENQAAEATPTAMQHDAPIEALPAEIRRQILLSLDVEELRTLVRASPVFHQQYRLDRRFILYHRLESSLGRAVVEACVLHRATAIGSLPPNAPGRTEAIRHFGVETWPARCSDAPYSVAGGGFTADEVGSMVLFHSTVIRPIAQEYATWALELLSKQTQRDRPQIPLSRYEETRVARALYRIQLICFLWGSASDNPGWAYAARLSPKDLFQSIEPWEIEEMVCIYIFLHLTYDKTFIAIRWELHPDLAGEFTRNVLLTATISCGLDLLQTVLLKAAAEDTFVATLQSKRQFFTNYDMAREWSQAIQTYRRSHEPSEKEQKQERRESLQFRGDGEPDELGPRPPLAWTWLWNGVYSNRFGGYVPRELQLWGYVMWDAARLEGTGAKELLERQRAAAWGGVTPLDRP